MAREVSKDRCFLAYEGFRGVKHFNKNKKARISPHVPMSPGMNALSCKIFGKLTLVRFPKYPLLDIDLTPITEVADVQEI